MKHITIKRAEQADDSGEKTLSLLFWFGTENDRCGGISGRSETPDPGDFLSGNEWSKNL